MGIIVYPPNNHQTDSPTIFFIGSALNSCVINNRKVELIHAGNFCPVFDLKIGENVFNIELDGEELIFRISRRYLAAKEIATTTLRSWQAQHATRAPRDDGAKLFHHICIDPGHGGTASGTCSPKGIKEKDLNLSLAKMIYEELNNKAITTILTRDIDMDLSLVDRVKIACDNDCDLFISVHHNAIPDDQNPIEHRGISVHYYYDENIKLAEKLIAVLTEATGLPSAGIIKQDLHVLRENTKMPAVLIEFGYLIHPIESEVICGVEFQKRAAEAIIKAIL